MLRGNTATASFTVTIGDTEDPVISGVPANITQATDAGVNTAVVTWTAPTAADNVGVTSFTSTHNPGDTFPLGATTVTYTATDAAGNTATASFTVTIGDTEDPVISGVPANITQATDAGVNTAVVTWTAPTAADNVVVTSFTSTHNPGDTFPLGATTVTYTATDAAGNTATASFTVTIGDSQPPVLTVPADIVVSTDAGLASAVVNFTPTATDNSGIAPTIVSSPASGSTFAIGTTTVTVTATDGAGNMTTVTFTVTVNDNEPPVVTVPADIVVSADPGLATAVVVFAATATDNSGGTPTVTASPASGSAFSIGVTTVTVTATDGDGNQSVATFTVTVNDDQPPVFTSFPDDIALTVPFGSSGANVSYVEPVATDNVPGVVVTRTAGPGPGSLFPVGVTTVTYEARDAAGNVATISFLVTLTEEDPAEVEIIVTSTEDGSVDFSSSEAVFNFNLNVAGGSGTSGPLLVAAGSYTFAFALPQNFGVTGSSCTDPGGQIDAKARTGAISVSAGATLSCTINIANTAAKTAEIIRSFLHTRGRLILSHQPDETRRMERLTGSHSSRGLSLSGHRLPGTSLLPFSASVASDEASFSWSLQRARSQLAKWRSEDLQFEGSSSDAVAIAPAGVSATRSINPVSEDSASGRFDLWVEARLARYEIDSQKGHFGIIHAGADYLATANLLVGIGGQVDLTDQDVTGGGEIGGVGWMAGPYLTARLSELIYFDARAAAGRSYNKISPFGTYTDSFDADRWLVTAALFGNFDFDALNVRPEVRLSYFDEKSESYTDQLGAFIPEQHIRIGELEFGPKFTWTNQLEDGTLLKPFFALEGIWTFEASANEDSVNQGEFVTEEGLRGRVKAGMDLIKPGLGEFSTEISYDGIGDDDFEAWSGKVWLTIPLN